MQHATRAFAAGEWESAASHCSALLHDYGDRPELAQLCQRSQLMLLHCRLCLQQWTEAVPLFEPTLRNLHSAAADVRGELLFQKAKCETNLKQYAAARNSLTSALPLLPMSGTRKCDAILLLATCMLECSEAEAAGNLVEQSLPSLPTQLTENAVMLGMRAFLAAKKPQAAFALFLKGLTASQESSARIGIQLLLLETASASLENGEPKSALLFAARIHPPERLMTLQLQRIAYAQRRTVGAQSTPNSSAASKSALQNDAAQLQAELDSIGNGASLAEATRLLTTSAYRALHRPYEAALVLEDAVAQLAPSAVMESASIELLKAWFELERWQQVIDSAERFSAAYPSSTRLPLVRYLKGCAEQKSGSVERALLTFEIVAKDPKAGELAPSADFMHALSLLLDNKLPEAVRGLNLFLQRHKKHAFAETAAYWLCVAKAQNGSTSEVRTAANAYLDSFPKGENKPAVLLKRAQALSALGQKSAAAMDLEALLREAPEHACSGEAGLLLGDCRLTLGNLEGALAAWRGIPAGQTAAREEGILKCAKLLFRCERFAELREVLRAFESPETDSARIAEAAAWLWKACERESHLDDAAAWTLGRIESLGNDPSSAGVEALLSLAFIRAGSKADGESLAQSLKTLSESANSDGRQTLDSRLRWASAIADRSRDAADTNERLIQSATLYPAKVTGPAVLADGADALETTDRPNEAANLWRALLKWHPGAPQRDRAFCALARLDCNAHQTDSAWHWVERFEKATPTSPLLPRVLLVKAALQTHEGHAADALGTLEQLLRKKGAAASVKSEALFRMGEIHRAAGATKVAISYLQRAYVSYGRFHPWAAKAYLASAQAFQDLGDPVAARNTYREFLASEAPADAPERALAISRLKKLEETP